jgi:CrcB protein
MIESRGALPSREARAAMRLALRAADADGFCPSGREPFPVSGPDCEENDMLMRVLLLAAAGAAGALCRYGLAGLVQSGLGARFPWGTLAVNLVGCFVAGVLFGLFESRWALSGEARVIVFIGFLGAFTTFSGFMLETAELARDAQWLSAAGNVVLQNVLGAVVLYGGLVTSRLV